MMEPGCGIAPLGGQPYGRMFLRSETPSGRALSPLERDVSLSAMLAAHVGSAQVCRRAVDETQLFERQPSPSEIQGPRSLIAHVALSTRADGIALGRRVFVRARLCRADGSLPLDLVAHEVTHVAQVIRDGAAGFYARYLAEYLRGRARGLGDHEAYLAIAYEVEARDVGARVRLSAPERPCE